MKLFSPLTIKSQDGKIVVVGYKDGAPNRHESKYWVQGQLDLESHTKDFVKWQSSQVTVEVGSDKSLLAQTAAYIAIFSSNGKFDKMTGDEALRQGIDISSLEGRIEVVKPDENSTSKFESFAVLLPEKEESEVKLPSDVEIEKEATTNASLCRYDSGSRTGKAQRIGFEFGSKWMRDLIQDNFDLIPKKK